MTQRALFERPQIAIRRSRHDDGIEVALLCMAEERTIPRLPMQLAPHRRDEPRDTAHVRICDGRLRQTHDRLSIIHRKDEVFRHIEHDLVPERRELFREDAVKIDLMPARRHDVLKNRDAHSLTALLVLNKMIDAKSLPLHPAKFQTSLQQPGCL